MKARSLLSVLIVACTIPAWAAGIPAMILGDPELPANDPALAKAIAGALRSAGYSPSAVTVGELLAPDTLSSSRCSLLVLPKCKSLPAALAPVVASYLKHGGNLIALSSPAWEVPLVRGPNGKWVSIDNYGALRALEQPMQTLFRFADGVSRWTPSTDKLSPPAKYEIARSNANGRTADVLHATISNLQGWSTLLSPISETTLFHQGQVNTIFSARGDARTRALAVEWDERDGSRWIATVPVTAGWQRFSLPPSSFHYWGSPTARSAQGFHPENAVRISVGLAYSHTGAVPGPHEYWISDIGTSNETNRDIDIIRAGIPPIDTLTPPYKFFRIHGDSVLESDPTQTLVGWTRGAVPSFARIESASPRPGGAGFGRGRSWRYIPLLRTIDPVTREWRGAPVTLLLHASGNSESGAALVCGIDSPGFYRRADTMRLIENVAQRLTTGLFFLDAGADSYTYVDGETVHLGARIMNFAAIGAAPAHATIRLVVTDPNDHRVTEQTSRILLTPHSLNTRVSAWQPPVRWPAGGYTVTADLIVDGKSIDRLTHRIYGYEQPDHPMFVETRPDGHFYYKNALLRFNGVNYLPSSGIAQEESALYEHWLSAQAYDPEVIERDLSHIASLGMNAISVFIYRDNLESHNLIDLLRRCRNHHLFVYLSLRPGIRDTLRSGSPQALQTAIDTFTTIIRRYHLERDDSIFAFEIDWEPNFGDEQSRRMMDPAWAAWITARYGSMESAERAWSHAAPRDPTGSLTNPSGSLLAGDDPTARNLVVDYRRFLDDWLAHTYGAATSAIHAIAPHQFVTFRMGSAGVPTDSQRGDLPYQFEGVARAVDFLSPECYERIGSSNGELGIRFEVSYARAVAPHLPFVWAETGYSTWDTASQADDPTALDAQGKFLDRFYKLAIQSGVDGVFVWWYPGGFRVGENSDYGIINPDGTARPATEVLLRNVKLFLDAPLPTPPDTMLDFQRDVYPDGMTGVYRALRDPFARAIQQGHRPGLHALSKSAW